MPTFEELIAQGATIDDSPAIAQPTFEDLIAQGATVEEEPSFWSLDYGSPDQTTVGDSIMSLGGGYLKGIGKGVTFPLELGALAGNKILGALTGYEPIPYPSSGIDSAVDWYTGYEPQTTAARSMETIADFGASAVGGGMLGKQLMAAAPQMANPLAQKIVGKTGDILGSNMPLQIQGALAAGGGAAYANEAYPDSALAQIGIPLLAGAGYAGAMGLAGRGRNTYQSVFDPDYIKDVARREAIDDVAQYTDLDALPKKIATAKSALATDPYAQYKTSAEVLDDVGLAKLQDAQRPREAALQTALVNKEDLRNAARLQNVESLIPEGFDEYEAVSKMRTSMERGNQAAKEVTAELADKAFKGKSSINAVPIKSVLTRQIREITRDGSTSLSPEFLETYGNFLKLPKEISFRTLTNYNKKFSKFSSISSLSTATEKDTARVAAVIRGTVDKMMDRAVERGNLNPEQKAYYLQMKKAKAAQGSVYEKGSVQQALLEDPYKSEFRMADEQVVPALLKNRKEVRRAKVALGSRAPQLEAAAVNRLYEQSLSANEKGIKPNTFRKGLKQLERRGAISETQSKVLQHVAADLSSEDRLNDLIKAGSKGMSPTAPRLTPLRAITRAIAGGLGEEATKRLMRQVPVLGPVVNKLDDLRGVTDLKNNFINEALLGTEGIETLLKPGPLTPKRIAIIDNFLKRVEGAAIATAASTEKGEEGPQLPPPADLYVDQREEPQSIAAAMPTPAPTAQPTPTPEAPIYEEIPQEPTAFAKKPVNYTRADIQEILKSQPPLIRAIAKVESNFNHKAKSKAGALGLMQLMPANIETFGIADPFDPMQSIEGATQLLAEELNRYKDDPRLAVAAYNAGSPAVDRAIKRAGSRDYAKVKQFLPQETRQYVPKVLAALRGA